MDQVIRPQTGVRAVNSVVDSNLEPPGSSFFQGDKWMLGAGYS